MTAIKYLYQRRAKFMNDKAARLGIGGTVTPDELAALPLVCAYCGVGLQHRWSAVDHMEALDRGGPNRIDNIVRACRRCNGEKFTKGPQEYLTFRSTKFECRVCGKPYRPRYTDWLAGKGIVCSRSCAAKWRYVDCSPGSS